MKQKLVQILSALSYKHRYALAMQEVDVWPTRNQRLQHDGFVVSRSYIKY